MAFDLFALKYFMFLSGSKTNIKHKSSKAKLCKIEKFSEWFPKVRE